MSTPPQAKHRQSINHYYLVGCESMLRDGYQMEPAELETLRSRVQEASARGEWVGMLPRLLWCREHAQPEPDGRP